MRSTSTTPATLRALQLDEDVARLAPRHVDIATGDPEAPGRTSSIVWGSERRVRNFVSRVFFWNSLSTYTEASSGFISSRIRFSFRFGSRVRGAVYARSESEGWPESFFDGTFEARSGYL
jgi:hypothetical protein